MPSLQVRNLPEQIYRMLQNNARKEHRSLSQQAIVSILKGLQVDEDAKERRRKLVERILSMRLDLDTDRLDDPVRLVREDRER